MAFMGRGGQSGYGRVTKAENTAREDARPPVRPEKLAMLKCERTREPFLTQPWQSGLSSASHGSTAGIAAMESVAAHRPPEWLAWVMEGGWVCQALCMARPSSSRAGGEWVSPGKSRARVICHIALCFVLACACARGSDSMESGLAPKGTPELPSADSVLSSVRQNLPAIPFVLRGQVLRGWLPRQRQRICFFDAELDFASDPASIQYTFRDAFGTVSRQMVVAWFADGEVDWQLEEGGVIRALDGRDFYECIPDTDVAWSDLALSFLWWRGGRTVGLGRVKGRDCYIVEFSPRSTKEAGGRIQVWIDMKMRVLLKMEEMNRDGQLVRSLSVKDFRRVSGVWMVKNLEIRRYPGRNRTLIRVDELYAPGLTDAGQGEAVALDDDGKE